MANFRMNHESAFVSFVNYLITQELPKIGIEQLDLQKQLEKDAMLQVILLKCCDRSED